MPHTKKLTKEDLETCQAVARLLSEHKARYGLSQIALGKMIKRSPKTISAIVNGRMSVTLDVGMALAKAFDVPVTEIMPKLSAINSSSGHSEIIDDIEDLSPENREMARRMVRRLLDSQEDD